jgi:hypothetical protein
MDAYFDPYLPLLSYLPLNASSVFEIIEVEWDLPDIGPITPFDKSFLQALNADEAVWFDHFSLAVICPFCVGRRIVTLPRFVGPVADSSVKEIPRSLPYREAAPIPGPGWWVNRDRFTNVWSVGAPPCTREINGAFANCSG